LEEIDQLLNQHQEKPDVGLELISTFLSSSAFSTKKSLPPPLPPQKKAKIVPSPPSTTIAQPNNSIKVDIPLVYTKYNPKEAGVLLFVYPDHSQTYVFNGNF